MTTALVLLLFTFQALSILQSANFKELHAHVKIQHGIRALHVKIAVRKQITVIFLDLGTFCRFKTYESEMATNTFRPEERLEGSTNYNSWKARLMATLEENDF